MRTLPPAALFGLLLVSLAAADPAKDDLDKLQGSWKIVSLEKDGKKQPEDALKSLKVIIKDDKFILKEGDKDAESSIKLDPSAKPKAIDLTVKEGDAAKTIKGIYQLADDDLKICAAGDPNADRPKDFATKPKANVGLVVLKREKP
jgi:uncharacterized protein (TIGR03067 family)